MSSFKVMANTTVISANYSFNNVKVDLVYKDINELRHNEKTINNIIEEFIKFKNPIISNENTLGTFITYDSISQKVIIVYANWNNIEKKSFHSAAIVGTIIGDFIKFGTPLIFNNTNTANMSTTYDPTNSKIIITYSDSSNLNYGTAIVGTINEDSIIFGNPIVFNNNKTYNISTVYDPVNNKIIIAYRDDNTTGYGTVITGTIEANNSIKFDSPVIFNKGSTTYITLIYDPVNNKIVIAYHDNNNKGYGTARVGSIVNDTIKFGEPIIFNYGYTEDIITIYDPVNDKIVIVYNNWGYTHSCNYINHNTVIVGTINGESITFGQKKEFNYTSIDYMRATYDFTNEQIKIKYNDKTATCVINGESITIKELTDNNSNI